MSALTEQFDDLEELLGVGVGALLVLIGLGTVSGTPWTTNGDVIASVLQGLGILLTIALGVALIYVSRGGRE